MDDFIDFLKVSFFIGFGIAIFIVPLAFLAVSSVTYECNAYGEMNDIQTKVVAGSCYLKEDTRWYRWDEYKLRNATTGTSK